MSVWRTSLVLTVATVAGCVFSPNLGNGQVRCGGDQSCPPGQICGGDSFCHVPGSAGADMAIPPDKPIDGGTCVPLHCYVGWCGPVQDGCGHTIDCGSCNPGADPVDMAGPPVDMAGGCKPTRMCVANTTCGSFDDGCGTELSCGDCNNPRNCSANKPFRCACTPKTCADVGATCGLYPTGCGVGVLNCFPGSDMAVGCAVGKCGGGGPYTCGTTIKCTPLTACPANACGLIPNGCNSVLNCGMCPAGKICGGGGKPNICG